MDTSAPMGRSASTEMSELVDTGAPMDTGTPMDMSVLPHFPSKLVYGQSYQIFHN